MRSDASYCWNIEINYYQEKINRECNERTEQNHTCKETSKTDNTCSASDSIAASMYATMRSTLVCVMFVALIDLE